MRTRAWKSARRAGAIAVAAACLAPGVASAETVGSTVAGPTNCAFRTNWIAIDSAAPADGVINSFSYQSVAGDAGHGLTFQVVRSTSPNNWVVVGSLPATLTTNSQRETFTPATPIAVKKGDRIGYYSGQSTLNGCLASGNQTGKTVYDSLQFPATATPVDGTFATASYTGADHLNLAADFTATISCTMTSVVHSDPFDSATVTVSAYNGLQSIDNVVTDNTSASAGSFVAGTTDPVVVTANKTTQGSLARFSFVAKDMLGNTTFCS